MSDGAVAIGFNFDVERAGDSAVLRCHGRLIAGVSGELYAEVGRLMPEVKRIVLDLTDVTYMDSMGLGVIVRLYVSTKSAGCELQLVNLGKRIRELLGVTHLLSVLTVVGENDIRMP